MEKNEDRSFITELPYTDDTAAHPGAPIDDEDIHNAITDDVLAQVKLAQRCSESKVVPRCPCLPLIVSLPGMKWSLSQACEKLELPEFSQLLHRFLYDQVYPGAHVPSSHVSIDACPMFRGKISIYRSASATFRAPSDPGGPRGMRCEYIHATSIWRKGHS